jgi:hypothetical protein
MNAYKLSMRRHVIRTLVERMRLAGPDERKQAARRLQSQRGIGSFLWRLFFGARK